ncbi:MAG: cell envelope integrity protein TolA [Nitrospirae bacterium]|nr:cell envelope integrity protein TolA [Nitrospirota bacterium]MBF0534685.1 cell envelope integrity protein TolA [Nitrospirota bacterium]MBF0616271.1 cell envelope integrity protein TolA [Nitrospirota bacterium]
MKQPSIQLAAVASLIIHAAAFMLLVYIANRHPAFNMPKAYTVNLVSVPKMSPANLPSKGEPPKAPKAEKKEQEAKELKEQAEVKEAEAKPPKAEPEKPAKTELKEPVAKKKVKPEKPKEEPKKPEKPKVEVKKPEKHVEKDKGIEPPKERVKDERPEKPKESQKPKVKPEEKPSKQETSKEDTSSVEDRIAALKAKKKLQQHAMQRAVVDVGVSKAKPGQLASGTGEGAMPSTGNVITDEYASAVSAHIKKRWVYPEAGKKGLLAVVTFTIRRNGQIENVQLEKKSGNTFYDRSALAAVTKSVPLPQPPYDNFELGVNFKDDF